MNKYLVTIILNDEKIEKHYNEKTPFFITKQIPALLKEKGLWESRNKISELSIKQIEN